MPVVGHVVVLTTVSSSREAARLSIALVKEKLAACVNVLPGIGSYYWWKGKMETAHEQLLVIKTRKSRVSRLIRRIGQLHTYDVPEIIALPIIAGHRDYLRWIDESLNR